ncbi:MAG: type II methionyl aminopeptidase [Candidatus Bathyarchaeota archaeon]|nr:type II methionyl aminopeptidase [Candidatus Bathyarchaeota archaeon]
MPTYDQEAIEKFYLSGKILRETRETMKSYVRENMSVLEICEKAEALIREKGGKPAFPCNVSINEVAAHYSSPPGDKSTVPEKSVVKLDMGVHVDGYVTDTATTVCFDPQYDLMTQAAQAALAAATENIRAGITPSKIGGIIENTIKNRGFKPISNLTGHSVGRYIIHAGTSIPNVHQVTFSKFKAGEVFAIEPFVTTFDANGVVEDAPQRTIFRLVKPKAAKSPLAKQLVKYIEDNCYTLPFSERWLTDALPPKDYAVAFKELLSKKAVMSYPVFVETSRKMVTQAEHTVVIEEDGCSVVS